MTAYVQVSETCQSGQDSFKGQVLLAQAAFMNGKRDKKGKKQASLNYKEIVGPRTTL